MTAYLYDTPILPENFRLPEQYINAATGDDFEDLWPWKLMSEDMALSLSYFGSMLLKFPDKYLVPFAIINDESGVYNDGWVVLACFDGLDLSGNPAVRLYDYSRPKISPWENMGYQSFSEWLGAARQEALDYRSADAG